MPGRDGEFSLAGYRRILARALELGYGFQTFADYLRAPRERVVLLRHDVDVSLAYALEMAELEASLHICSTFFVRLHASFYNLLEARNLERLRELAALGFEIGLHQEVSRFAEDRHKAMELLKKEKELLEFMVGRPIPGVSAHLPKWHALRGTAALLAAVGFTYAPGQEIFNRGAIFVSDSNRRWKGCSFLEALGRGDKILANIHPVWWVGAIADPAELIEALIAGR